MDKDYLAYKVGGLLYVPALRKGVAKKIINKEIQALTSVCFCLEDSIADDAVEEAEKQLLSTLTELKNAGLNRKDVLLFVRVRSPRHLQHVHAFLNGVSDILTGYILPKFDFPDADEYKNIILSINSNSDLRVYFMPIIESPGVAGIVTRRERLLKIKEVLADVSEYILNVRVGVNDFSNIFGLRRPIDKTVYDVCVLSGVLSDIINVFSDKYIISGPVWEYFGADDGAWAKGLERELELDRLNGFIGKTAIHPCQLRYIYESLKVRREDFNDAKSILNWDRGGFGVEKSSSGDRMNEVKCHYKWAERILILSEIYGIKD
ncbi:MAG: HpcH/HpaI aldolase/citrate lyase family protein [Clostridia bacterium]|nr:HpcH/HpaI aldolase/citrate lyase family protein [Clostridia bacterium]